MKPSMIIGIHAVCSALEKDNVSIERLLLLKGRTDKRLQQILTLAEQRHIPFEYRDRKDLDKVCNGDRHQGVIALIDEATLKQYSEHDIALIIEQKENPLFLVLDTIQDPHNLGACLRSANAAGVDAVITPKDKSVGLTPIVRKVACGAAEHIPFIAVTNLARSLKTLQQQGVWIYGLAGEAEQSYFDINFRGPTAIVMGAEQKGLRRLTREHCDDLIKIPMKGQVESLNVSVATGVVLFEVLRQRG